jgi:serine/threonine-protein kinase
VDSETFRQVEIRAEVERLLAADVQIAEQSAEHGAMAGDETDPLARLVGGAAALWIETASEDATAEDSWLGRTIGAWRIERRLGSGGMSTVYLAERADREMPMRAALKRIRRGLHSAELVARFRTERRILASLIHPNIARLLDGGTAPDGSPYFVMELVEGEPIDRFADRRRLGLTDRIRLVSQAAAAVAAAHRSLVVHRDLKPSNILVDAAGVPKLLDFGIAKLLGSDPAAEEAAARTVTSMRLFTPAYASPEQLEGGPVTTATDVYSLGVVLCELLCGRRPYRLRSRAHGERSTAVELERAIRENAIDPPSLALARHEEEGDAGEIARRRGFDTPRALARALTGDLDTIVTQCLRKEPERRYTTAERLAEDLERYLERRPIEARRDSWLYRSGKLLSRHRWAASFAALALAALLAFTIALAVQSSRLATERDTSRAESERAELVAGFLTDLFQVAQPGASGETITARELLDRAALEVTRHPRPDPREQAMLLDTVGNVYLQLDLPARAEPPLRQALALRRKTLAPDHPEIAVSLSRLGMLAAESGAYERAIVLFREALALRRRRFGSQHTLVAASLNNLALALQDRGALTEAEPLYRETIAIDRRLLPPDDPQLWNDCANFGLLLYDLGDYAEAESLLRSALAARRDLAEGAPERAELERYLGLVLVASHHLAEAERILTRAEAKLSRALGPEHSETARATASLAELRLAQDRPREAIALYTRALANRRERTGRGHPEEVPVLTGLGRAYAAAGEAREAEACFREAIDLARRVLPPRHPDLAAALTGLAALAAGQGRCAEVPALAAEAQAIRAAAFRPGDPRIAEAERLAAACVGSS